MRFITHYKLKNSCVLLDCHSLALYTLTSIWARSYSCCQIYWYSLTSASNYIIVSYKTFIPCSYTPYCWWMLNRDTLLLIFKYTMGGHKAAQLHNERRRVKILFGDTVNNMIFHMTINDTLQLLCAKCALCVWQWHMAVNDFTAETSLSPLDNAHVLCSLRPVAQITTAVHHYVSTVKAFTPKLFSVCLCLLLGECCVTNSRACAVTELCSYSAIIAVDLHSLIDGTFHSVGHS